MTKEDFDAEVYEYAKSRIDTEDSRMTDRMLAYRAGAEPREKKIEELERKLEQTEKDLADYQFNYPTIKELEQEKRLLGERCNQLLKDKGELTDQIADIKANCDLAIEGRDIKIKELEQQIEKMKCCQNCDHYRWSNGDDWCNVHLGQPMYDEECKGKWKLRR